KRGRQVSVGLTSDDMASRMRDRYVEPFEVRRKNLGEVLDDMSRKYGTSYSISEITDRFGFATRSEIDSIVVSEETEDTVSGIDEERKRNGLPVLKRFVVPMVGDRNGRRISSTRVSSGEIDAKGNLQGGIRRGKTERLCVHLGSKNPDKAKGLEQAFKRHAPMIQLLQYDVADRDGYNGVIDGAMSRCLHVIEKTEGGEISSKDYFVGIEAGMVEMNSYWFLFHCCVIENDGVRGIGMSSGIEIPGHIVDRIMVYRGKTWETEDIAGVRNSLIENLSGGSMSRITFVEESCRNALLSLSDHRMKEEVGP
ncbi:MAG: pantetheine-phosphate adenylyltransferase, partial [Candidatus Thermoplasmatota archaeon]|nr:pantetheine-phosphate adenylyltransferase [Candidatus Thermoplasmatota archaeon]